MSQEVDGKVTADELEKARQVRAEVNGQLIAMRKLLAPNPPSTHDTKSRARQSLPHDDRLGQRRPQKARPCVRKVCV
jgi:hypothetical protein